ncbi:UbiA family prenyltransferase [Chitinophaga sp. 30R24]|uniref:UbiA family prenyltransferase n=1 Tax=Chitinophaga sp. 30R24 TaxID=3248838 RepID=UPI003B907539
MLYHFKHATALTFHEINLVWKFVENDLWDTIVPCLVTFITAFYYCKLPLKAFPIAFLIAVIYTFLYILTFCVTNQLYSVEEDRLNKPTRPLVTGFVTLPEAKKRLLIYNILFIVSGILFHVFLLALAWMIITYILCKYGSAHWITKNLVCITAGTITLLAAEWKIVGGITGGVWQFIIILSFWAGFGLPVQDMRDQAGDKIMGRKTLPLAIGDLKARYFLCAYYFSVSPLLFGAAILSQIDLSTLFSNTLVLAILGVQTCWHWAIGVRLLLKRTPQEDDATYHWFVYMFIIGIPLICLFRK